MRPDPRTSALVREAETATTLLAEGVAMITREDWRSSAGGAAWTCLASGAERLLKLTIGLTAEAEGKPWPASEIRNLFGHRLATLRPDVDTALARRLSDATSEPYIRSLVDRVRVDPYLPLIFEALGQWAESAGRYRDFDVLGGGAVDGYGPAAAWDAAESRVWSERPELLSQLAGPNNRAALAELRSELAASLARWWFLHYRAWAHGVFGSIATQHSSSLDPREVPVIRDFAEQTLAGL